jgi:hypothetical protein
MILHEHIQIIHQKNYLLDMTSTFSCIEYLCFVPREINLIIKRNGYENIKYKFVQLWHMIDNILFQMLPSINDFSLNTEK